MKKCIHLSIISINTQCSICIVDLVIYNFKDRVLRIHSFAMSRSQKIFTFFLFSYSLKMNLKIMHTLQECPLLAVCSSFQLESVRALVSDGKLYSLRVRHRISRDPDRTWYSMNLNWSTL